MNRFCILLFLSIFFQTNLKALDASISFSTFMSPHHNYIEVYLHVVGGTVNYVSVDSAHVQGAVEVILLFKQREEIVKFDKYRLNSPVSKVPINFIDQRRYALENGEYTIEASVQDVHDPENSKTFESSFTMDYRPDALGQSDIQLLVSYKKDDSGSPFTKNGYYLESLPFNFYDKSSGHLLFYNELYHTDKVIQKDFMVRYAIEKEDNGEFQTIQIKHKRRKALPVNVLLFHMDISKLESGNYRLLVEVRNENKELLSSKSVTFTRSNPYLNIEESEELTFIDLTQEFVGKLSPEDLRYCLKAIAPVVAEGEVEVLNLIISNKDSLNAQRRYLFTHWVRKNPNNPETAFNKYMEVARAVDKAFHSGFGYGFETDRGHIFMKYGKPSDMIAVDDEPSAPPYEIWIYYDFPATNQANVKFLFYNPTLGNDYTLLHSTARGERNNPRWEVELYQDAPNDLLGNDYINGTQMQDGFNRQARRYFSDF